MSRDFRSFLNWRALAMGLAIGVLGAAGLAFAQAGDSTEGAAVPPENSIALEEGIEPVATGAEAERIVAYLEGNGPNPEPRKYFESEGPPAPEIIERCRAGKSDLDPLVCEALIAIAEGGLAPGAYSEQELQEKLGK